MDPNSSLAQKIRKQIVSAVSDYSLIEPGDRILVAVSGGKDSSILMVLLKEIQKRAKIPFEIEAVILDQKQPGFDVSAFQLWVHEMGVQLTVLEEDTYSIVTDKVEENSTYCSLCSRLRRGILYNYAAENGFNKLALGHHRDDVIETVLMNAFFSGRLAGMPPVLKSDDQRNVLIRPMCYVAEEDLQELAVEWSFPIIPCNLCGSQDGLQRQKIKGMIKEMSKSHPFVANNLLAATKNVRPSQLMDPGIWDFQNFESRA